MTDFYRVSARSFCLVCVLISSLFSVGIYIYGRAIPPDRPEYQMCFDLIEGDGEHFKHQFDSLVKVMYEYNIAVNSKESIFSSKDPVLKRLTKPIGNKSLPPIHDEYKRRIISFLETEYDYSYDGKSKGMYLAHTTCPPRIEHPNLTSLFEMYLTDAPNIEADGLYDKWVKFLTPTVMFHRYALYLPEYEAIKSISKLKGTPSPDSDLADIIINHNVDLRSRYPESKFFECVQMVYGDNNDKTTAISDKIPLGQAISPDSIQYRWTYDLIDGAKGDVFKLQFDSLVTEIYNYNIFCAKDKQSKANRDHEMGIKKPIPEAYFQRIMPLLEILYDYKYYPNEDTLQPYLTGERPEQSAPEILPLLKKYLSDAHQIKGEWLYQQWIKIVRRDVMQHRLPLYQKELETLNKIAKLRELKDSTGNALYVYEASPEEIKEYFPWSGWAWCKGNISDLKEILPLLGINR